MLATLPNTAAHVVNFMVSECKAQRKRAENQEQATEEKMDST